MRRDSPHSLASLCATSMSCFPMPCLCAAFATQTFARYAGTLHSPVPAHKSIFLHCSQDRLALIPCTGYVIRSSRVCMHLGSCIMLCNGFWSMQDMLHWVLMVVKGCVFSNLSKAFVSLTWPLNALHLTGGFSCLP